MADTIAPPSRVPIWRIVIAVVVILCLLIPTYLTLRSAFRGGSKPVTITIDSPQARTVAVDPAKVPVTQAIVINPLWGWHSSGWGESEIVTDQASEDLTGPGAKFIVYEPQKRRAWLLSPAQPIDIKHYPIAVIRYKATNVPARSNGYNPYLLWANDGTGGMAGLIVFKNEDLTADGQEHTVTCDLRPEKAIRPPKSDKLNFFALGVDCGPAAPATFELLDLRFEAAPEGEQPAAVEDDAPFTVHVTDPAGKPVEGVTVTANADWLNFARAAVTDAKGQARITPLKTGGATRLVRVEKAGFAPAGVTVPRGAAGPVSLTLEPAAALTGVLRDEDAQPVAGAIVELTTGAGRGFNVDRQVQNRATVVTDDQGRFRTPPLAVGPIYYRASHPDYAPESAPHPAGPTTQPGADLSLVIRRGIDFDGAIVNGEGKPVAGAVRVAQDAYRARSAPPAYADAQGRFRVVNAAPGPSALFAEATGLANTTQSIVVSKGMAAVKVVMTVGQSLRGQVIDPDRKPVAGASVSVYTSGGRAEWTGRTDADGRFAWSNAPAGQMTLYVYKQDCRPATLQASAGDKEYVLTLAPTLRVRATVTDAETAKPIDAFTLTPGRVQGLGLIYSWDTYRKQKITTPGQLDWKDTDQATDRVLKVEAPGYLPAVSRVIKVNETDVTLEFKLKKAPPPAAGP